MPGYAVIDFETTGLFASRDRVIEVAVVHVDESGVITGQWDSLVNPNRDLGAQHIHRIAAADIIGAPTFEQIVPTLVRLLSGRVIVAHNASFDTRFLVAELERAGYDISVSLTTICTMQLAREFLPGSGRSLADCCAAYDIELVDAHRASADALATAKLLSAYIGNSPMWSGWGEQAMAASDDWPPHEGTDAAWFPRGSQRVDPSTFLQRISIKLPEFSGPSDHLDYLALLDRCLLDRNVSLHEADMLVELAETVGISQDTCRSLHSRYFEELTAIAWSDGVLTIEEIQDLVTVGKLLSIPADQVANAMQPRTVDSERVALERFVLQVGDHVVLTGEMSRPRDHWHGELVQRGFVPWAAVTEKVRLVVAADPDSLSGKARKARDYGIPIIGEPALEDMIKSLG